MFVFSLRRVLVTLLCVAGSAVASQDWAEDTAGKWDTKCTEKGCVMFTDILRGDLDHPADSQHPEYLTVAVGVDRATRRPSYFAFYVPPSADPKRGLFITFSRTVAGADGRWHMELDKDAPMHLDFETCNQDACVATLNRGTPDDDGLVADLADRFSTRTHVLLLYVANGEPLRTVKALSPFQKAYKQVVDTQLR